MYRVGSGAEILRGGKCRSQKGRISHQSGSDCAARYSAVDNQGIGADIAKDAAARSSIETADVTIRELDGKIYTKESAAQIGASANNYQGVLRISEDTRIRVECLTLRGKDATVYTNQHYVRYVPDRKDESPHEVITNIIHREIWTFTEQGWKVKYIEELERGNTYLDGKLYNPE